VAVGAAHGCGDARDARDAWVAEVVVVGQRSCRGTAPHSMWARIRVDARAAASVECALSRV